MKRFGLEAAWIYIIFQINKNESILNVVKAIKCTIKC